MKIISKKAIYLHYCAPSATRTPGLLLRRHFPASPGVALCRLTSALAAAKIAGRSLTSPGAGGRWLPVWLPEISLAALMAG